MQFVVTAVGPVLGHSSVKRPSTYCARMLMMPFIVTAIGPLERREATAR